MISFILQYQIPILFCIGAISLYLSAVASSKINISFTGLGWLLNEYGLINKKDINVEDVNGYISKWLKGDEKTPALSKDHLPEDIKNATMSILQMVALNKILLSLSSFIYNIIGYSSILLAIYLKFF